jgi:TatA/E family protein of Tat protein translocase
MDFFDIGSGEILLVIVLALLLFGPHKIPEVARNVSKVIAGFKRATAQFSAEVTKEIDAANRAAAEATKDIRKDLSDVGKSVGVATNQVTDGIEKASAQVKTSFNGTEPAKPPPELGNVQAVQTTPAPPPTAASAPALSHTTNPPTTQAKL